MTSEVRFDDIEVLVQSGWLHLGHRAATEGTHLRLERSYAKEDFAPFPVDTWQKVAVSIPSFAHPFRQGSSLRMSISSPGRNHGTWEFENPVYDGTPTFHLGRGGDHDSALRLRRLPGIEVPEGQRDCTYLRGQACRAFRPVDNVAAE